MATDIFKIKPLGNQAAAGKTSAGSRTTWSRRDLLHALVVVGNVTAFILVQLEVPDPYLVGQVGGSRSELSCRDSLFARLIDIKNTGRNIPYTSDPAVL